MKKYFLYLLVALFIFTFTSCNDPIFYDISREERILEPRIKGSPTNFVEFNSRMYVGSGNIIYRYESTDPNRSDRGVWHEPGNPGGTILQLAVYNNMLYALCRNSDNTVLRVSNNGENWSVVPNSSSLKIRSIYSAGDQLFLGAGDIGLFKILRLNGTIFEDVGNTGSRLLNGVAYNNSTYYLCTNDLSGEDGYIYSTDGRSSATVVTRGRAYMGIIFLGDANNTVAAIARNGNLYVSTSNFNTSIANLGKDKLATGALAVWKSANGDLLLAGRQDQLAASTTSGNTFGYMELRISDIVTGTQEFVEPGINSHSTVRNLENGRFKSTIGKFPVNHIYHSTESTLFASTQKDGVWSYRNRSRTSTPNWQWNAEQAEN